MLFLLLLSTSVSSEFLATPAASDIQAFTQDYTIFGSVKAGTQDVYSFRLKNPSISYMTVSLKASSGDVDLEIATNVGTSFVMWSSRGLVEDKVHIEATHPALQGDGKKLERDWEISVQALTNAQYTLFIKLGSGTAVLATDLEQTYHKVTAFSTLMEERETSGSQSTTATVIMVLVNLGVFAAAGFWALRRQKAVYDGIYT